MKGLILQNSLIRQAEAQVEQRLKEGVREPYQKIVVAGMKYAMKGGPESLLAKLKDSQDPITDAVKGAIGVVGLLRRAAKGAMPVDALVPAAMTLALQALDFLEKAGVMKIGKAELDQATQLFVETIMPLLGVTPDKMQQITGKVTDIMQDPEKMRQLQMPQQGAQNVPA